MARPSTPVETMKATGRRLLALRLVLNLKQNKLAEAIGASRSAYANWETGERLADINKMLRLDHLFDVSLDYIYAGKLGGIRSDLREAVANMLAKVEDEAGVDASPLVIEERLRSTLTLNDPEKPYEHGPPNRASKRRATAKA